MCVCPRCCLISSFQKFNVSEALNEGSHVVDLRSVENWQPRNKGQYNSKLVCKTEIPRSLAALYVADFPRHEKHILTPKEL